MKKFNHILLTALVFLGSCTKEYITVINEIPVEKEEREIRFFLESKYNAASLLDDRPFNLIDSSGILLLPYLTENRKFVISFEVPDSALVSVGETMQVSGVTVNDFTDPVTFTIQHKNGKIENFRLSLHVFTGLPIFWINTEEVEITKEVFVDGSLRVDANGQVNNNSVEIPLEIRGRGNSTWEMPKKPFRIRFRQNTPILGFPSTRNWVLLANFADKTLMRNHLAFDIARQLTSDFVPRSNFVELFLNGAYQGTYQLTDHIRVESARVNIPTLRATDNSPELITGGYFMEMDDRLDEITTFRTEKMNLPIAMKDPEIPSPQQLDYIKNYLNQIETSLLSDSAGHPTNGVGQYIDMTSFVNWYLVNELSKNNDAAAFSSIFMVKDRGQKLKMGPVWDFDIAFGNINYNGNQSPEGWWVRESGWYKYLFQIPAFESAVKAKWDEWKTSKLPGIFEEINGTAYKLRFAQQQNFGKWQTLYNYTWPNATVLGTYENEVQYLKDWLNKRIIWMDNEFSK